MLHFVQKTNLLHLITLHDHRHLLRQKDATELTQCFSADTSGTIIS